ncbi:hypothetical protein EBZ80_17790 [bacterium]|nr:hypothetical protein [bacterium]
MFHLPPEICALIFSFDSTFHAHFDACVKPFLLAVAHHDGLLRQCRQVGLRNDHWRNMHIADASRPQNVQQILSYMHMRNGRVHESCACIFFFAKDAHVCVTMMRNRHGQKRWFVGDNDRYRSMIARRCKSYGLGEFP